MPCGVVIAGYYDSMVYRASGCRKISQYEGKDITSY